MPNTHSIGNSKQRCGYVSRWRFSTYPSVCVCESAAFKAGFAALRSMQQHINVHTSILHVCLCCGFIKPARTEHAKAAGSAQLAGFMICVEWMHKVRYLRTAIWVRREGQL